MLPNTITVIGRVSDEVLSLCVVNQLLRNTCFVALALSENHVERLTKRINKGMDFRREAASGASYGVRLDPPFPPAACW